MADVSMETKMKGSKTSPSDSSKLFLQAVLRSFSTAIVRLSQRDVRSFPNGLTINQPPLPSMLESYEETHQETVGAGGLECRENEPRRERFGTKDASFQQAPIDGLLVACDRIFQRQLCRFQF